MKMKYKYSIIVLFCSVLLFSGCAKDILGEVSYPVDQVFPKMGADALYISGDASGLSTPAVKLDPFPGENAKTYYGIASGSQFTAHNNATQMLANILDGVASAPNINDNNGGKWMWFVRKNLGGHFSATSNIVDVVIEVPEDGREFDLIKFVNRNWANGFPRKYNWYVSTVSSPDVFIHQAEVIQSTGDAPSPLLSPYFSYVSTLEIPNDLVGNVAKVKFRINFDDCQANGGHIAIREIEFWKKGEVAAIPACFTDQSCSALKEGTLQTEIDEINSEFFKNVAQALFDGIYDVSRVITVAPVADPSVAKTANNAVSSYSEFSTPTGVSVGAGDNLVVFATGVVGTNAKLTILWRDKLTKDALQKVDLVEGLNDIKVTNAGTVYLSNFDVSQTALKVNIANGVMNGIFDVSKHTDDNLPFIMSRAGSTDNIDLVGARTMLTVGVSDVLAHGGVSITDLLTFYDEMVLFQQNFTGMPSINTSKLHFFATTNANPLAAAPFVLSTLFWSEIDPTKVPMQNMLNVGNLKENLFYFAAVAAGPNIPLNFLWKPTDPHKSYWQRFLVAAATQDHFDLPSFFADNPTSFDDVWEAYFVKNGTWNTDGANPIHTVLLWQLYLYMHKIEGETTFYTEVIKGLETSLTDDKYLRFAEVAQAKSGFNLRSLFDCYSYPTFTGTGKPLPFAIEYLTDGNLEIFKNSTPLSVANSTYSVIDKEGVDFFSFDFTPCSGAVAYEIYLGGTLAWVSPSSIFEFEPGVANTGKAVTAKAISFDGTKLDVTISL